MEWLNLINAESMYALNTLGKIIVFSWIILTLAWIFVCIKYIFQSSRFWQCIILVLVLVFGEICLLFGADKLLRTLPSYESTGQAKYTYQITDNSMQKFFNDYEVVSYDDTTKILTVMEKNN